MILFFFFLITTLNDLEWLFWLTNVLKLLLLFLFLFFRLSLLKKRKANIIKLGNQSSVNSYIKKTKKKFVFERKVSTLKIKSNVNHLKNKQQIHYKKEKKKKKQMFGNILEQTTNRNNPYRYPFSSNQFKHKPFLLKIFKLATYNKQASKQP